MYFDEKMAASLGEKPLNYDTVYESDDMLIDVPYNYIKPKDHPHGYMKVFLLNKNEMARISFYGPYYIYAEENGNYKLNKDEIDHLIKALNEPHVWNPKYNNFQTAIQMMNYCHHNDENRRPDQEWEDIPEDLPMPDYTKLK